MKMNRLPTSTRPEPTSIILDDDDILCENKSSTPSYDDVKRVLKDIGAFKTSKLDTIKSDLNMDKKQKKIKQKMQKLIDITSGKLSANQLLPIVLQCVEDYIHVSDKTVCNELKLKIVTDIMHPIMDCSDSVFKQLVELSCKTLKKSTFWRRNKQLARKCLGFFLNLF